MALWGPSGSLAASDLGGQGVERSGPEAPELVEPRVHVPEPVRAHGVEAASSVGSHRDEPSLAEHAQLLGHRWLGDGVVALDRRTDRAGRQLTVLQQLEDPSSGRVPQDVQRVHGEENIRYDLYKYRQIVVGVVVGRP